MNLYMPKLGKLSRNTSITSKGWDDTEKWKPFNQIVILVGESFKEFKTRGCDTWENQKQNHSKWLLGWTYWQFVVQEKVMGGSGTWIDWQYLFDAARLLAKCR